MHFEDIPIVVISLDRRPDRWAAFLQRAESANIQHKVQRLSAVDANDFVAHEHPGVSLFAAHNIKHKTRRAHHEIDMPGAIGCSLSHFKAWKTLLDSSAPALIIFEDDSTVPVDFKRRMEKLLTELPESCDVVSFYNTTYKGGSTGCSKKTADVPWQKCTSLIGSHAYMVTRRGAQRLLDKAYPIELHVDAYIAFMSRMDFISLLWNPVMQIPAYQLTDSDINHGGSNILNIPSNMERSGIVALELNSVIGIAAMAAVVGGLVALAYVVRKR